MIRKLSFILSFLFIVQFSFATPTISHTSNESAKIEVVVNKKGKRKKNGRYKKKRGLFKRIFKGKSNCDCPKH
ncbi:hypothetical protein [Arcticibacterium luteifluviistationis]|uniref:Uncharacterized protein n=1 Tax=Arcticibacterium luteifluviistationis TaxID=1784714 RepID=A0A2Z4GDM4_9BACT|nr:hypothetical protein [Arcticibacterium luteifluviistationis]AWV99013.1 hypothetical protein DJ013_12890 [Arcticibacterium luteifluviistationis]